MAVQGLFTRVEAKQRVAKAPKNLGSLSAESLHKMGTRAIRGMNPDAVTPEMEPSGSDKPWVYVLGEAPNESDDRDGEPFTGPIGRLLEQAIRGSRAGRDLFDRTRFNNVVRTMPQRRGKGSREPSAPEIECFRPSIEADIEKTRPIVIVGCGQVPLAWAMGDGYSIGCCRGRMFPIKVRSHACWFLSVHHPQYVYRVLNRLGPRERIPGAEYLEAFKRDINGIYAKVRELPPARVEPQERLSQGVTCLHGSSDDLRTLRKFLKRMRREKAVAFDLETNRLRPYESGAKVLTMAIGTKKEVLAFPLDHIQSRWSESQRRMVGELLLGFFMSKGIKVAHNLSFDLEWLVFLFGTKVLLSKGRFHCSQAQAYVIDRRKGGMSLNFLTSLYYGFSLKKMSKGTSDVGGLFGEEETDIDRAKLERTDLASVLKYNGLDTKYTHGVYRRQRSIIRETGLLPAYVEHIKRIPSLVLAQWEGLPVSQSKVEEFQKELSAKEEKALDAIQRTEAVRRYTRKFGRFLPSNNYHVLAMFRDVLKRPEGIVKGRNDQPDKYTTEEEALSQMTDEPLAGLILELRGATKLKSTYVDPLSAKNPDSVLYPDGKIHCQFKHTLTDTARLSAADPSVQNFPKHEDGWVRSTIGRVAGTILLAADYGQLEARVIGMASKDPFLVKALWTDYDIHLEWAEKIAHVSNKVWRNFSKDIKKLRAAVKNQWVFPAFYGSQLVPIARAFEVDERKFEPLFEEFWETFQGVKKWQKRLLASYRQTGFVETLTGRRLHGPLNENMVFNYPIQSSASDMVINAMNRLARLSLETDHPHLAPRLNIHDDLTFLIPKPAVEESQHLIVREMLRVPFEWVNVPITIEVSHGRAWYPIKEVGKFRSDKYEADPSRN